MRNCGKKVIDLKVFNRIPVVISTHFLHRNSTDLVPGAPHGGAANWPLPICCLLRPAWNQP
jgi:hypothetical protein